VQPLAGCAAQDQAAQLGLAAPGVRRDNQWCPERDLTHEVSTTMTTASQVIAKPAIEYPDDDGEPMADNTLQFKWIVLLTGNLEAVFRNDPDVFVAGNLLWYPVEREPSIRAAPDAMVALGRPKGRRGSYKQWEEGNIAPQVVFETLSPGNRQPEMDRKFTFYEQYGVEEYYIYDPDDGTFEAWFRRGSRLVKVENVFGLVSPRLGIRFEPGEGPDNLKIFGPDGKLFQTQSEDIHQRNAAEKLAEIQRELAAIERQRADAERQCADAERQRAEAERQRAEAERQRAEAEQQRADRLSAKLRDLGVEPD
jgi:Uma2 family endonuclease